MTRIISPSSPNPERGTRKSGDDLKNGKRNDTMSVANPGRPPWIEAYLVTSSHAEAARCYLDRADGWPGESDDAGDEAGEGWSAFLRECYGTVSRQLAGAGAQPGRPGGLAAVRKSLYPSPVPLGPPHPPAGPGR